MLHLRLQPVSQIICLVYIILVLPFSQEFIRIQIVALHLYPDVPLPAISFHGLQALILIPVAYPIQILIDLPVQQLIMDKHPFTGGIRSTVCKHTGTIESQHPHNCGCDHQNKCHNLCHCAAQQAVSLCRCILFFLCFFSFFPFPFIL